MGQLEVVRELVVAGADPVAVGRRGETPLTMAHDCVHVLAFLMQFPAVRASIDHESQSMTALGWASTIGDDPDCVELLLGAGANPTIPGRRPLEEEARLFSNQGAFNVLRAAIPEPGRARALHKVCSSAKSRSFSALPGPASQPKACLRWWSTGSWPSPSRPASRAGKTTTRRCRGWS